MKLTGNKIIITGATAGIGLALTKKLLELDNKVIAIGRNEEALKALAKMDSRVIAHRCDISQDDELERLAYFLEHEHQDVNIMVNNAGIQYNYDFNIGSGLAAKIDHEVMVNLIAPIKLIALLLPSLSKNKNAAIVNVSSGLGLVPKAQAPVYCGTKAGLHIFTKSLRHQLDYVKVFEIIPPLVDTAMTKGRGKDKISPQQLAEEFIEAFRKDRLEIAIGKVKWLKLINRLSPALADRIMK